MEIQNSKGLLDKKYSENRKKKMELQFRLSVRARIVVDFVDKYASSKTGLNILDLGAAEGRTLMAMNNYLPGNEFTGVEYSKELINEALDLPENIKLINGDVTKLPDSLSSASFDVVSALAVLEHLENPANAAREAFKMLKPGGLLIATCPIPSWDHISNKLGLLKEDHHEIDMNKQLMIKILKDAGFSFLEYRSFMWAPISFMPYLHIPVSGLVSLKLDRWIERIKILNWLFVNQAVVGQKQH